MNTNSLYYESLLTSNNNGIYIEPDPTIAKDPDVKLNHIFQDANSKETKVGSMPIIAPTTTIVSPGETYTIPLGYHDGKGIIQTDSLETLTPGTATDSDVAFNKTFWVNGEKHVGTLDKDENDQVGTATADDIALGKTAWVNRTKITGTLPNIVNPTRTLECGESYTIPKGISDGTITIKADSLYNQTQPSSGFDPIGSSSVLLGYSGWVNGTRVTGMLNLDEELKKKLEDTDAKANEVVAGKTFYSNEYEEITTGTMVDHSGEADRYIKPSETYNIPEGYYSGNEVIKGTPLEEVLEPTSAHANTILDGYTAYVSTGEKITGIMPNNGTVTQELEAGESITLERGYYETSTISAASLEKSTAGTAKESDILIGETAWVNGEKITGTMAKNDTESIPLSAGDSYTIPEGYHTGVGNVWARSLAVQTVGDATKSDIKEGKVAWVNGEKITGGIPEIEDTIRTLLPGESYIIPYGIHGGAGIVRVPKQGELTPGTATTGDILEGKTAWVNGEQLTGIIPNHGLINREIGLGETVEISGYYSDGGQVYTRPLSYYTPGDAYPTALIEGKTAWVNGEMITGIMPKIEPTTIKLKTKQTYMIPEGYHTGSGKIEVGDGSEDTPGTATANDLLLNKTAWVNGLQIEGTIKTIETPDIELGPGKSYTVSKGYYAENGTVTAKKISEFIKISESDECITLTESNYQDEGLIIG